MAEEIKDPRQVEREAFLSEYKALIDKYQFDFISFPQFIPNEQGNFEVRMMMDIVDKKQVAVKSDIIV